MASSKSCALFVDHENIFFGLLNELGDIAYVPNPNTMAAKFREAAETYGTLKRSKAIADWEQSSLRGHVKAYIMNGYQIDYNITGKNNADLKISNEIRNALENEKDDGIETYIIVTGDGGYQPIIETLFQKGKKVIIWGVQDCTSSLLQAIASEFECVERLLDISQPNQEAREEARRRSFRPTTNDVYTISQLEALVINLDRFLLLSNEDAGRNDLIAAFTQDKVCGETAQEQEFWLNQALSENIIHEAAPESEENIRPNLGLALNAEHPLVEKTLLVKTKLFKMLKDTLSNNFCPDFKRARDTLVNMIPNLTKSEAHTWLNWFIQHSIVITEKRPHQQKPGAFFTVLRLNGESQYVQSGLNEWPGQEKIQLLVLLVDDFLSEKGVPWVAASTLLKILKAHFLREGFHGEDAWLESKDLLNEALKVGVIAKRNERDPMTGFETSQIYISSDHEEVQRILSVKNTIIQHLHEALRERRIIAWSTFVSLLKERTDYSEEQIHEWIDLLSEEEIVLLKVVPTESDKSAPVATLTLNYAKPVVVAKIKGLSAEDEEQLPENAEVPATPASHHMTESDHDELHEEEQQG